MSSQVFSITYLIILLVYIVGSIVMIYHIFAFGINLRTARVATIAYVLGSIFLLWLLYGNLQTILQFTN